MKDEYSEMIPKKHHREIREALYGLKSYEKPKKKRYKIYCKYDNCKQGLLEDNITKLTEEQKKVHREFQSLLCNTFFIECKCD